MDKLTNIYLSENLREGAVQFQNFGAYVNKLTIEDSRKNFINGIKKNDKVKANSLLKVHFYDEVIDFMLTNNCKLEQKIISWLY